MFYAEYNSPIGQLRLYGDGENIVEIVFPKKQAVSCKQEDAVENTAMFDELREQLDKYFDGTLQTFSVPLAPAGTAFQKQVWQTLQGIAYGETTSYGRIADSIGKPTASRAVGAANGANPIPIVIPCHRVIGSNGKLTGFAGGLATKQWLLSHETGEQALFSFEEMLVE